MIISLSKYVSQTWHESILRRAIDIAAPFKNARHGKYCRRRNLNAFYSLNYVRNY